MQLVYFDKWRKQKRKLNKLLMLWGFKKEDVYFQIKKGWIFIWKCHTILHETMHLKHAFRITHVLLSITLKNL